MARCIANESALNVHSKKRYHYSFVRIPQTRLFLRSMNTDQLSFYDLLLLLLFLSEESCAVSLFHHSSMSWIISFLYDFCYIICIPDTVTFSTLVARVLHFSQFLANSIIVVGLWIVWIVLQFNLNIRYLI